MIERSETMKILMVIAASAMSAILVLPTVSHAQSGSIGQQASQLADRNSGGLQRLA
jgi:hypothetical protein